MPDIETVQELVRLMVENDLTELNLHEGDWQVSLKRGPASPMPAPFPVMPGHQPFAHATGAPMGMASTAGAAHADDGLAPIRSPMVGTFYSAANPETPAFVKIGDMVGPESVVCIIEAMKVFNEIKAEVSGVVERVLVSNQQPVEFGQPMFLVRPT